MIGRFLRTFFLAGAAFCCVSWAQSRRPDPPPPQANPPEAKPAADPLGRGSPRGTLLGFVAAAHKGDYETAAHYLNTPLNGNRANTLARQLSVVLDRRLSARINQVSSQPEGSQYNLEKPDTDLVGTIDDPEGKTIDLVVQRIDRGKGVFVWLFSKPTLDAVPVLFEMVNQVSLKDDLPRFLTEKKIVDIPLFEWLFALLAVPLAYLLTGLLDRLISPLAGRLRERFHLQQGSTNSRLLPVPGRLLVIVIVIRWAVAHLDLPYLARQFWYTATSVVTIIACLWLVLMLNAWGERRIRQRMRQRAAQGGFSILRLVRWTADLIVVFTGLLVLLRYFSLNVSAALAGLGVGGIAVALAAQKTLENIIGGISIIADRVVRVGHTLKIGDTTGTVEDVGLRSTRIRTYERSIVSIPNGQISNERLEDLCCRDKFWFHPILNLQYETTADQMRAVLEAIRNLLLRDARVEDDTMRVRFLRFGISSLDVDIYAYVFASDTSGFLEVQEELLLRIMDAVQAAGTRIALPSQATYVERTFARPETEIPAVRETHARN